MNRAGQLVDGDALRGASAVVDDNMRHGVVP
jgi:hypothetical protein